MIGKLQILLLTLATSSLAFASNGQGPNEGSGQVSKIQYYACNTAAGANIQYAVTAYLYPAPNPADAGQSLIEVQGGANPKDTRVISATMLEKAGSTDFNSNGFLLSIEKTPSLPTIAFSGHMYLLTADPNVRRSRARLHARSV